MVTFCSLLLWQPLARHAPVRSVEDPSARVVRLVKAKGHAPSPLFRIAPDEPDRCQTGLYMSLTPHCLRELRPGVPALGVLPLLLEDMPTGTTGTTSKLPSTTSTTSAT